MNNTTENKPNHNLSDKPTMPDNVTVPAADEDIASLRRQMHELKATLDSQRIFSDKMLRDIMARRNRDNERFVKAEKYFVLPFCALLFLFIKYSLNVSWLFYIATMIFILGDLILDIFINNVHGEDFARESLVSLRSRLVRQQRLRRKQMIYCIPFLTVWCLWFLYELVRGQGMMFAKGGWLAWAVWGFCIACGFALGLAVAFAIYRKMQRNDADSVSEIDSMNNLE